MTSNKRIHELLKWVNQGYKEALEDERKSIIESNSIISVDSKIWEIGKHLLEVDIENNNERPICPNCEGNKEVLLPHMEAWLPQKYIIEHTGFAYRTTYEKDFCIKCNDKIFKEQSETK